MKHYFFTTALLTVSNLAFADKIETFFCTDAKQETIARLYLDHASSDYRFVLDSQKFSIDSKGPELVRIIKADDQLVSQANASVDGDDGFAQLAIDVGDAANHATSENGVTKTHPTARLLVGTARGLDEHMLACEGLVVEK